MSKISFYPKNSMVLKMNSGLLNQELLNAKISESAFTIKDRIQ